MKRSVSTSKQKASATEPATATTVEEDGSPASITSPKNAEHEYEPNTYVKLFLVK